MTKQDLLNEIIQEVEADAEEPNENITEDTKIIELGLDSFGITMLLTNLDCKYEIFTPEEFKAIDYDTFTVGDLIEKVIADGNY